VAPNVLGDEARLIAGFDPVAAGPLSRAREFDVGTPVYDSNMSGPEVRRALGLA
jgi:8-hydroxy-5-deazaflavin:NADPH oxidoreductase